MRHRGTFQHRAKRSKSFLVLFFKKELLSLTRRRRNIPQRLYALPPSSAGKRARRRGLFLQSLPLIASYTTYWKYWPPPVKAHNTPLNRGPELKIYPQITQINADFSANFFCVNLCNLWIESFVDTARTTDIKTKSWMAAFAGKKELLF